MLIIYNSVENTQHGPDNYDTKLLQFAEVQLYILLIVQFCLQKKQLFFRIN